MCILCNSVCTHCYTRIYISEIWKINCQTALHHTLLPKSSMQTNTTHIHTARKGKNRGQWKLRKKTNKFRSVSTVPAPSVTRTHSFIAHFIVLITYVLNLLGVPHLHPPFPPARPSNACTGVTCMQTMQVNPLKLTSTEKAALWPRRLCSHSHKGKETWTFRFRSRRHFPPPYPLSHALFISTHSRATLLFRFQSRLQPVTFHPEKYSSAYRQYRFHQSDVESAVQELTFDLAVLQTVWWRK